jgi:curli biogenesis system outer membrane secretion channel CsgG
MKVSFGYILPFVALAVTGCASSKISDLGSFQSVPMKQTEHMPSKSELSGAKSRVIVFALEDKKWSGAGESIADIVSKELNSTNNVVIVDRSLASNLGQEIQLAETKGRTGYQGQDVADFAITGKVTEAGAGVKFTEASTWTDKDGKSHYNPAQCTTSGKVAFSLKVVQLPSLDVIKTIDEDATASATEDAPRGRCPDLSQGAANGIVSAAIGNAVQKAHTDLKNQFAPSGYVVERRNKGSDNIFKTTLGTTGGAKEGLEAKVIRSVTDKNALTGVESAEQVVIAEGLISDQVGASFSYLIISDKSKADSILLGDKVQIVFKDSFMDSLNKIVH